MLYGRAALVDAVARSQAPVLILTGDSGVGKSAVLAAAQAASDADVAPAPQTVGTSGGALQRALLDGLADAVALVVQRRGRAREVADRLGEAARALGSARLKDLAVVVHAELLQIAQSRLGPEFGQALADYIGELRTGRSETLAARVQAARDPSVVDVVLALAVEVAAVAERPVLLAVDAAERLSPDDVRTLGDVPRAVTGEVRLRVGFATYALDRRRAVDDLLADAPEIGEIRVSGLGVDAVAEWLVAEGLDEARAEGVLRVTDGYPLLLNDLVRQLQRDGEFDVVDRNAQFARLSKLAWDQLDPEARRCARLLALLEDPLPEHRLRELCGLDAPSWGDVVQRLERGMLFSTQVNGIPWFHEQRRSVVRDFLRTEEIDQSAGAATDVLLAHINETGALERSGEVAAIAAQSPTRQRADPKLLAALELDLDELSVAAALLELTERAPVGLLAGAETLRHSRSFFPTHGDLIDALERLTSKHLALTAEAHGMVVVVAQFSVAAAAVIGGRAQRELGRLPVPAIGSLVFEAGLAPRLNPFSDAQNGLGAPDMGLLSQWAAGRELSWRGPHYPRSRAELGHNVIVRANYRGRPLVAAVRFASADDRDAALARLNEAPIEVLGIPLTLRTVTAHPLPMVAPGRFVRAAERAAERSFTHARGLKGKLNEPLCAPLTAEQAAEIKVEVPRMLAERCDSVERWAFGLDAPWSLHWLIEDHLLVEGEVRGGRAEAVRHRDLPRITSPDPFEFFRWERAFDLTEGESLVHLRIHGGENTLTHDPVLQVIGQLRSRAEQFNASQTRRHLVLERDALTAALLHARRRELDDARALVSAVPLRGERLAEPEPQTLYALVAREDASPGWVPGARSSMITKVGHSASGDEEVHVAIVPGELSAGGGIFRAPDGAFEEAFGRVRPQWSSASDLLNMTAQLLGHSDSDLWFDIP